MITANALTNPRNIGSYASRSHGNLDCMASKTFTDIASIVSPKLCLTDWIKWSRSKTFVPRIQSERGQMAAIHTHILFELSWVLRGFWIHPWYTGVHLEYGKACVDLSLESTPCILCNSLVVSASWLIFSFSTSNALRPLVSPIFVIVGVLARSCYRY